MKRKSIYLIFTMLFCFVLSNCSSYRNVEKNNKITIEISNSFSDTGLKIDDISKKGVSSKGENRGLGLYKVKDILSRYPKIKHETTVSNGMFLQRLIIDKVKLPIS